jgi:nucleoside-diphosphate-sugar epimerase
MMIYDVLNSSKLPMDLDAIIHLPAQIHFNRSIVNPEETFEINVDGTHKIVEFARMNDMKKMLHASTSEVYGSAEYVHMDEHPNTFTWMNIILRLHDIHLELAKLLLIDCVIPITRLMTLELKFQFFWS